MNATALTPARDKRPPVVVYFYGDMEARDAIAGTQKFMRAAAVDDAFLQQESGAVVIISAERILANHWNTVRGHPRVRVIAISNERFKDPRLDGAVYAYLPPQIPSALVERMVENALSHIHLLAVRHDFNERLADASREIDELNRIGAALSAEHDTRKLLELILTKSRQITSADAGSLFLVEGVEGAAEDGTAPPPKCLRFTLAQNDTVHVDFRETTIEISERSIAGYVAMTGETVNLEDAYHLPPEVPYSINRKFDEDSGYRTKSILAIPMRNQKREIVGVVQLLNAKRDAEVKLESLSVVTAQVIPFSKRYEELATSLASQAAVALENSRLYEAIQRLFEGFVKASVTAIEARDPTTSGHSFRVANLTVALAETVDRIATGSYAGTHFTRDQMKEIRYASLLHDFGKVGVREEVLVKARKLYPAQLELMEQRFQFVKRTLETEALRERLDFLLKYGREAYVAKLPELEAQLATRVGELDAWWKFILESNLPTVLPEGSFDKLQEIARAQFSGIEGEPRNLITPEEVRLLSIRKGSLDEAERTQIESHVVHTFHFLSQIPWTREIRTIPDIARSHHEKLNGRGYPQGLGPVQIPVQARMMTISDIFDALAASDRPYKKAVSQDRALDILAMSVKDGELDSELFNLFLEAKVYERWKVEPYPY